MLIKTRSKFNKNDCYSIAFIENSKKQLNFYNKMKVQYDDRKRDQNYLRKWKKSLRNSIGLQWDQFFNVDEFINKVDIEQLKEAGIMAVRFIIAKDEIKKNTTIGLYNECGDQATIDDRFFDVVVFKVNDFIKWRKN